MRCHPLVHVILKSVTLDNQVTNVTIESIEQLVNVTIQVEPLSAATAPD